MDSVHVGMMRDSMQVNPLIIRPTLGKAKPKGMSCPGPDFVYGIVTNIQDGGVAEAISSWHTHSDQGGRYGAYPRTLERDFVALNREGVKSGLVTAKEHSQYRATHDVRRRAPVKQGSRRPSQVRGPPDMTFGMSTRPSTPISELLEYKYAQRWLEEQQEKDRVMQEHQQKRDRLKRIQETRTTLLRKSRPVVETTTLWKLPRFEKVGPALDTFRDPAAREKARSAHFSDGVARRGRLGHGTYAVD
ncbi:cilia- and flagella-associated protein 77 isoform X2 [Denticeps clupeoides]|uniref:Uncharacterized protein n=1 Tax=Denticeps clupeoides TaxID=299321 RepID=A0AAY4EMY5_9TELE|nr:cilia- and flagella-associated protein 77 isoform X2 [Denticeps clupeoides]